MAEHMDIDDPDMVLPVEFTHTPIRALRVTSRKKLAQFLDLEGNLMVCVVNGSYGAEEIDIVNNYNGLAELVQFGYLEIKNMARCKSPTEELLNLWTSANEGGPTAPATIGNLWNFLIAMERYDVIKDCRRTICHDCRVFEENQIMEIEAQNYNIEQDPTVSNSDMKVDEFKYADVTSAKTGESVHYNAFICYTWDDKEDLRFVKELIMELEVKKNLKLFVPGRDDLPGSAYHTITAYMIEKKCDRVVLVMSKSFLKSAACDFQLKFAHSLAPGARSKKLIPVIRDRNTPIPRILRFLAMCDFSKADMRDWVLDRLYSAIIAPIGPDTYISESETDEYYGAHYDFLGMTYPKTLCSPFYSQSSGIDSTMDTGQGDEDTRSSRNSTHTLTRSSSGVSTDSKTCELGSSPSTTVSSSQSTAFRNQNETTVLRSDSVEGTQSDNESMGSQSSMASQSRRVFSESSPGTHALSELSQHQSSETSTNVSRSLPSSISQFFPSPATVPLLERAKVPKMTNKSNSEPLKVRKDDKEGKNRKGDKDGKSGIKKFLGRFEKSKTKKCDSSAEEGTRATDVDEINSDNSKTKKNIRKYNNGIVHNAFQMTTYPLDKSKELCDSSITSSSEFVKVEFEPVDGFLSVPPCMTEYIPRTKQVTSVAAVKSKPKVPPKPDLDLRGSRSPPGQGVSGQGDAGNEKPTTYFV